MMIRIPMSNGTKSCPFPQPLPPEGTGDAKALLRLAGARTDWDIITATVPIPSQG